MQGELMPAKYVLPPEHYIFERDSSYLALDPINFVWFVTDLNGKKTLEALGRSGNAEETAVEIGEFLGLDPASEIITNYVSAYIDHLLKIGFIFEGEYKREEWGPGVLEYPKILYLHLTSKCNLKCPYCYNQEHRHQMIQTGKKQAAELPIIQGQGRQLSTEGHTAQFLRIIDEAAEMGFREVKLTGGEALLNKDALLIAAHAKSRGLAVNLLTNGALVKDDMIDKIGKFVDAISISLDSDKAEEHDAVRGKGTHQKVIELVEKLKQTPVRLHLNAVVTPVNLESVGNFLDYAYNQLGADEATVASFMSMVEDPEQRWGAAKYGLNEKQYHRVYQQQRDFIDIRDLGKKRPQKRSALWRRHCGVGNGIVSIDPNGDVYPCQTLHRPEFLCGNAFQSGLKQVLDNSEVLKMTKRAVVDVLPECKTCPVRYVCASGCRFEAYTREGDFLARNRAMCPTFYEAALDNLWNAAALPIQEIDGNVEVQATHASCR